MQSKVVVSLIVFLFPALIAPLFILALLTKLPGPYGAFFLDYSISWLWGCYLLLAAGAVFTYFKLKRYEARKQAADKSPANDEQPLVAEAQASGE